MEININKFRASARLLMEHLRLNQTNVIATSDEYKMLEDFVQKKNYTGADIKDMLRFLSSKLLHPLFTESIALAYEDLILLLVTNSINLDSANDVNSIMQPEHFAEYQHKCVALAKLMHLSTDAKSCAINFFLQKPAPFQHPSTALQLPQIKKAKIDTSGSNLLPVDHLTLLKCCHQLLTADPIFFKELWNWAALVEECLNTSAIPKTDLEQLYSNNIVGILTNMSSTQLKKLNANIPAEVNLQYEAAQQLPWICSSSFSPETEDAVEHICINIDSDVVCNIEGVLLPIYNKYNYKFYAQTDGSYDKIVKVDSTRVNLRSIALGIAASKTICLSGPVGCGKTTLVEYLARRTGRIQPKRNELTFEQQQRNDKENSKTINLKPKTSPSCKKRKISISMLQEIEAQIERGSNGSNCSTNGFLRIQLGDQTDSKMLLGQYRCTDVPGEFIWLPGVLTQAVMHGYWLLLEDLDSAPQDTFTILSNLLENNFLSVPGFRDCVKIEPGFQLFVTVRTNKSLTTSSASQKSLFSLLEKYLYTINILPLSRNELCKVVSCNYPKLYTVANRIVDVFLTFSSGNHAAADNLRRQESSDKADTTEKYLSLPFEEITLNAIPNSGRLVSTRDLIKLCQRSDPMFNVTSAECAYFVFQNAVDVFCSYLPQGKEKTKLISSIGAKLGIIQSRCEFFAEEYKPDVKIDTERIKVGRGEVLSKTQTMDNRPHEPQQQKAQYDEPQATKRLKITQNTERSIATHSSGKKSHATFSFTRLASCILERIAVCVAHAEPVLLVGETGVGKTSAVQYLAERTQHRLVVVNMNNQSDVSDLLGGFKPVDLTYVVAPLRTEFEVIFRSTFNQTKNETFLNKFAICYNQGNFSVIIKLMLKVVNSVFEKSERNELPDKELQLLPRWQSLRVKLLKLNAQLTKSINISFAFIPGALVNCIKNGDWVLLDEINLASAETLECLSTILEPDGSVVLLEKGDFTPVKRHPNFRIFACMNPNTDIGKKDLSVGIRNRFTEFYVDELTTDADLTLLIGDYLSSTGIQKRSVTNIVKLYKRLKTLSSLELNDGLGNRPVYSLRTLCRSLRVCARNLCGSIERNLYESFCMSFLTQLDPISHNVVLQLIKDALLSNAKAVLSQGIPKPGESYLNFEGYWIEAGSKAQLSCDNYILTASVKENLKDLARIISIGKLPILLQGPTSAGKTSLIEYVAKRSGNHCLRINNHEHTDLQEYIGTYTADVTGKLSFREGVLVQAMRNGYWIILDELNLASTDILEALNRVLDDNRELFIPETQTVVKAHANFMLFATQNPPGLYGGRKTLSRAFKNRFIELHFSEIPRPELEIILEQRCLIPASYAKKMVMCMSDLQKNRKTTSKNVFTLRDLFRWGNRYTYADKKLLADNKYDWNQHLVEEGYLVLSAKVRTIVEIEIIEDALYRNFKKRINQACLFDAQSLEGKGQKSSAVTGDIIQSIKAFKQRADIVWTRNMTRMAVLTAKALQFNEPVLLVGPTGCGKTTICQILASIHGVTLRILNCHMHTEGADFLGGLRPCRQQSDEKDVTSKKLFEWADGPLIYAMREGSYFMADEISLAEDSVLERLNCVLEPERTLLLAEKGGVVCESSEEFVVQAHEGFKFLATMNPGGDFGKKELSPALRNRFTEIWCQPSDSKEDLIQIANNCLRTAAADGSNAEETLRISRYMVEIVFYISDQVEKFKFSVRDILAWANYMVSNKELSFAERAIFGLETIFLDALEMLPHESLEKVEQLKAHITDFAIQQSSRILKIDFTKQDLQQYRGPEVVMLDNSAKFGIKPFFIARNPTSGVVADKNFLFDAPTTKNNLFRLLSALSLRKPILLEGPPGVGKTSIVESIAGAIGYNIVRINLCEHTDLADLFGTDLPAEDKALDAQSTEEEEVAAVGTFVWRDGPLLAALKAQNTWILLDELNLAPQSVLEGLNAILDHRGEVYIPELNKTFQLSQHTHIFACQNPLRQGGGRKGLPQSFLNRFNKVYLRKLTTEDLLYVVNGKYAYAFEQLGLKLSEMLQNCASSEHNLFKLFKNSPSALPTGKDSPVAAEAPVNYVFDLAERLVKFSEILDRGITEMEFGYKGGPYEINLRDILRWCDLLLNPATSFIIQSPPVVIANEKSSVHLFRYNFKNFLLTLYERMKLVYYQRMRSEHDKAYIRNAFSRVFDCDAEALNTLSEDVALYWTDDKIYLNDIVLERLAPTTTQCGGGLRPLKDNSQAPLLLSSQRELLKNLIECVHMEKPVLLCGPTDSGKTKLIDTLCTLSNQICNTDSIDDSVTGSFQQIDLNRHLEEISQSVEFLFNIYVQNAILENGSTKFVIRLLSAWSDYNKLSKLKLELNSSTAMSEELIVFRKRIGFLHAVIEQLTSAPPLLKVIPKHFLDHLQKQQRLLNALKYHTSNSETLNTGGSFEWVDSKIVKTLKTGQYISLEHVNLCSSAVLDRLNPVFESNGSLLISERGVTANDEAEIVEKAPNFRAFLTIDPKNGELSRAMRNRCVELALVKDSYDIDDMRIIVYTNGVTEIEAINCILRVHALITQISEINYYTISHLTQFAFLTASYKRIGYTIERAIYVSGMEVYVYAANIDLIGYGLDFYQNKLRAIVLHESKKLLSTYTTTVVETVNLKNIMLNTNELNETTLIKLQLEPLRILLQSESLSNAIELANLFKSFENYNFTSVNKDELLRCYIYIIYETSTISDVKKRNLYLQTLLKDQHAELLNLSNHLYASVESAAHAFNPALTYLPWNNMLYARIRDYATHLAGICHQKVYRLSALLISQLILKDIPQEGVLKLQQIDALSYSQAVAANKISDKLKNTFLEHFADFLQSLQDVLRAALNYADFNIERYTQIISAYLWHNRLLKSSKEKLFIGKEVNTVVIDKLLLHFKWLDKHLLKLLSKIAPNYNQINPEFEINLQKLSNYVFSTKHPLNLMRKVYTKQMSHFQPLYSEQQLSLHTLMQKLENALNVVPSYRNLTKETIRRKFVAQKLDSSKICRAYLQQTTPNIFDFNFKQEDVGTIYGEDTLPKQLCDAVQQFIAANKELNTEIVDNLSTDPFSNELENIIQFVSSTEELPKSLTPKSLELDILALREYYLNKYLAFMLTNKINSAELHEMNENYVEALPSLNVEVRQLLQMLKSQKYANFVKLWIPLQEYIQGIRNAVEFRTLLGHLKGNYASLCTFERIITNVQHKQQLDNLASRGICSALHNSEIDLIDSSYTYDGPILIRALLNLMYQNNGDHKSVSLQELELWQQSLKEMRQLLWHNANLMGANYSTRSCNLKTAKFHAKKLLLEIEYVKELCENMENENFTDYNENFQKLVQSLSTETLKANDTLIVHSPGEQQHCAVHYLKEQYVSSLLNALIGAVELCLLSFTPLIDPVEKNRLKNLYILEDINSLTTLTTAYDFMRIIMKYKNLGAEIYTALEGRLALLAERQIKYAQKVALRPEKCFYKNLVQDVKHFLGSNCEPAALLQLIQHAQKSWSARSFAASTHTVEDFELCNETLSKIEIWLANAKNFVYHVLKRYSEYYQDFVQPLICSVERLRFGLEGLKTSLIQQNSAMTSQSSKSLQVSNLNSDGKLHQVLANIVEFPASRDLEIYNVNSCHDILKNRAVIFSVMDKLHASEFDYFRLLKAKIIELKNIISISANLEENTFQDFDFAFNICNQIWQAEEDRRRKQKAEEESLYVNKTKCATEDEELIELQEIEENFPTNVQEDFGEFLEEETLEKVMKLNDKEKIKNARSKHQVITDEDYTFLAESFINVMERYSQVYYHNKAADKEDQQLEFQVAFKDRMRVFVKLCAHYRCSLNEWLDERTYNSFCYAINLQQNQLNELSPPTVRGNSANSRRAYNFYKDSNIPEIIACTEVLHNIEDRVRVQLDLYPEHAGLIDIIRVIERIRQLPSTTPVVRFNTGFQLLRQKVALWNGVAHKNNHLRNEEIIVAEFVQKWTRLELQYWRTCLEQTLEKVATHAYRYWFFIYNLFQEYLQKHELDSTLTDIKQAEKRFADGETHYATEIMEKSTVEVVDIVRILRQFVEFSNYGDFHIRLQLLRSFELYLHNLENNQSSSTEERALKPLISSLHNLHLYFQQFSQEIEDTKRSMRTPIEKKLKEFVKIESYNKDLSYFSMRNNIARVHRNLNKFLKEYRLQLQQKITPVFQPKDATVKDLKIENDREKDSGNGSKIKFFMIDVRNFIAAQKLSEKYVIELDDDVTSDTEKPKLLLQKIRKLFKTSRNVVKQTVSNAGFPKLIIALDELFCQQLERCDNLRNLDVDRTRERPQQKLQAKQILQQKRKGLTDLFKSLTQLGLSYKSGLMELSLVTELEDFTLPPFCIRTMVATKKDKRVYTKLTENLDLYYGKCIFKLKLLKQLMLAPLSELGPPNIERIKGYAIDMFLLVQEQRRLLANTTKNIYDLRLLLKILKGIGDITASESVKGSGLEFIKSRDIYVALRSSLCRIRFVMEQFYLLLTSVPTVGGEDTCVRAVDTEAGMLVQNSPLFIRLCKHSDELLQKTKKLLFAMQHSDTEFISFEKLSTYHAAHAQIVNGVHQLRECCKSTENESAYLPLANSLTDLMTIIEETTVTNFKPSPSMPTISYHVIDTELENIVHTVLLSLQKLYKKYPAQPIVNEESKLKNADVEGDDDGTDEMELSEQHLKKKLHAELLADWEVLNVPSVISKLSNVMLALKHSKADEEKLNYLIKFTSLIPILEQFQLLAEYYLFQQLGSHRVAVKMLSVMLTVFVEISSKGFCVPSDLMQDEEGQSKKDQKEGEGFGLEDGTGEKDASDKIESEDQLEDAKRPEDRQDDNDKKQDDCKEEKGIEMSDDFDGKMQDIEKPENEEDDSGESEDEEDLNKEMGETEEGAEKLDDQIWGDDEDHPEKEEDENDMEEEDGKGSKDEKESHNDLDSKNDAAKDGQDEHEKDGLDATQEQGQDDKQKKKEKQSDIDNMKDPEVDEEHMNPFHNELEEPPEPEEMDLGNMNNVDDGQENVDDEQQDGENPFDIDAMKENMQTVEESEQAENEQDDDGEKNKQPDDNVSDTDDSDEGEAGTDMKEDVTAPEEDKQDEDEKVDETDPLTQKRCEEKEDEKEQEDPENTDDNKEEKPELHQQSKDKPSKEENVQSIPETENTGSADQVQNEKDDKNVKQEQKMDEQETGEEKDGVGQAENDTNEGGHQGIAETKETVSKEDSKNELKTEQKRKQGRTDEKRTLGEAEHNKLKQLKTIDKLRDQNEMDKSKMDEKDIQSEEYQHVKEPKDSDKTTLDNATEEQTKQLKHQEDKEKPDEEIEGETADDLMDIQDDESKNQPENENLQEISAEQFDQKSEKPSKSEKTNERAEAQEEKMEIEGEDVQTITVARNNDTTAHCIKEILLDNTTTAQDLNALETLELRKMYQQQMTSNKTIALPQHADYEKWQTISTRMVQNARELCEQLRLILEPTKCTRLKGDYRTGRRINMKKIIPYIASQFRKDKIWLRRTKPAQRDYKITIAIDDSKSMHHNNSKTLTLEAISLVYQALTLLESGRLSILSFGESPQIVLNHTEQLDGPKLVNALTFDQDKTKIAELLDFVRTVNTEESSLGSDNGLFENLLLVLSDGRNIFSEGKVKVKNAIKLARLQRIFLVYIIIDNPENKNSILDIQAMEMLPDKRINIKSYLDDFPFPYYVIVRDLNQLPLVLSEAMRQWFELVNSEQ